MAQDSDWWLRTSVRRNLNLGFSMLPGGEKDSSVRVPPFTLILLSRPYCTYLSLCGYGGPGPCGCLLHSPPPPPPPHPPCLSEGTPSHFSRKLRGRAPVSQVRGSTGQGTDGRGKAGKGNGGRGN